MLYHDINIFVYIYIYMAGNRVPAGSESGKSAFQKSTLFIGYDQAFNSPSIVFPGFYSYYVIRPILAADNARPIVRPERRHLSVAVVQRPFQPFAHAINKLHYFCLRMI